MSIGKLIKSLRTERNLTQKQLARAISVDVRRISFYENNKMIPSTETLQRMSKFFKVSVDFILGGEIEGIRKIGFRDQELLQLFHQVERFQQKDKEIIKEILKVFIFKNRVKDLSNIS